MSLNGLRYSILVACVLQAVFVCGQNQTQIFDSEIKTLRIGRDAEKYGSATIQLGSDDVLKISFDQMSHLSKNYGYTLVHCKADWTESEISTNEYIDGFTSAWISDYQRSVNTTTLYTNYSFSLPNNDMKFKISGNYLVKIYETDNSHKTVAQVRIWVYEPKVLLNATVRYNTDIELNGRYQQLDFELNTSALKLQNTDEELKVVVRQNNRSDNEVTGLKPTYINGSTLKYTNNPKLIFEGGNEFHVFDISSVYNAGRGVESVKYIDNKYSAFLLGDKLKPVTYEHSFDANGKFVINNQEAFSDSNLEADYMDVYFELNAPEPFLDGKVLCQGDFNYNIIGRDAQMIYDFSARKYIYKAKLKQGGYNYQYRFLKTNEQVAKVEKTEGSFWQTGNEYAIFVYYKSPSDRYDRLVAYNVFNNI